MIAFSLFMSVNVVALVITGGVVLLLLGLLQLYLGLKAQSSPDVTGPQAMIGRTGIIRRASGFRDRSVVEIRGELWWCIPISRKTMLHEGATVKVVDQAEDSMILEVDTVQ